MDVKDLNRIWGGFQASRVLLTANHFRVFDRLESPREAEELAKTLKTDQRATRVLLDALAGIGLLKKAGGKYRNAPAASRYLVTGKPAYQGDIIRHADVLWQNWSALNEVMLTGLPARRAQDHRSFIAGMDDIARLRVKQVVAALDLKGVRTVLDLGGGPATYSVALARRGLEVTLYDRPETMRMASDAARKAGVRLRFRKGDFITDPIGNGYDLVLISQIFHAYPEDENIELLEKCAASLNPGGGVAVQEMPVSEDLTQPAFSALFSVNMLVNTMGGRCYSPAEMRGWLRRTGFKNVTQKPLGDTVLIMARKK